MTVYIEKVLGEFRNVNTYAAWRGFSDRGAHCEFFAPGELDALPISPENIVVAGIPIVQRALQRLNVSVPQLDPIPCGLERFAGRETGASTLQAARERVLNGEPIFIKPRETTKLSGGHVVTAFRDFIRTSGLPDDLPVFYSELVHFKSEHRAYLCRSELLDCRHYKGDFRVPPDYARIDAGLAAWQNAPAGCAMDWGVTDDNRTLLIEVNDGYALGNYGLHPSLYAALLEARWQQLVQF